MKKPNIDKDPCASWKSSKQLWVNEMRPKLIKNETRPERLVRNALDNLGIEFIPQKPVFSYDYIAFIDFYLKRPLRICLEIDGPNHFTLDGKKKDAIRERNVIGNHKKMRFIRMTNEEVMVHQSSLETRLAEKILEAKRGLRPAQCHLNSVVEGSRPTETVKRAESN